VSARLAFDFKKYGADYVRESLYPEGIPQNFQKKLIEHGLQPELYRENLIDWADELSMMGLHKVAAVVFLEVAELRPSQFEQPPHPRAAGGPSWREDVEHKREQWKLKRKWQATYGRLWTGRKVPEERFWHHYDTEKLWHRFGMK
jgi:hypothetical protein